MTTLVLGASGATGRLLVTQLRKRGEQVRVIVRSPEKLPAEILKDDGVTVIKASVLDLTDAQLAEHAHGCRAVASCLGHNMSLKGIFGPPRRLVTDATRRMCEAIKTNESGAPTWFVLMNTAGNSNRDLYEPISFAQKCVMFLLRWFVPPHVDNEAAADYLRTEIGQHDQAIGWVVVRPDGLVDSDEVTKYELHPSPTRSAIFNSGTTSRINVGHFMAELIVSDDAFNHWRGQMPVIYNKE